MKFTRLFAQLSIGLLLALIMVGCANMPYSIVGDDIPPTTRITGWKQMPQSLTVVFSSPFVSESLRGDELEYAPQFSEWLAARLQVELKGIVGFVPEIKVVEAEYFDIAPEKVVDVDVKIPYIKEGANDSLHGLVLSISPVIFYRNVNPCAGPSVCLTNTFPVMKGSYSYMDADTRKVYGFGEFFVEDEISSKKETGDWETAVKGMLKQVLNYTPLRK